MKFRESLIDNKETYSYESKDGDLFVRIKDKKRVKKSCYILTSKVYKCFDWNKDGFKTKSLYFTEKFEKYRLNSLENITSFIFRMQYKKSKIFYNLKSKSNQVISIST